MNRDALLATLIGFVIGITITGIIVLGPVAFKNAPKFKLPTLPSISIHLPKFSKQQATAPTAAPSQKSAGFSIDSPLADAIEQQASILVSGSATPGSTVVVQGAGDDMVAIANDDGKYATKVTLTEGRNDLTATAYGKNGTSESLTVTVFFTPEGI